MNKSPKRHEAPHIWGPGKVRAASRMGGHYKLTGQDVGLTGDCVCIDSPIHAQNQNEVSFSRNST